MGHYHIAQVCLNGHLITSAYDDCPSDRQAFCEQCGTKTISECPVCHKPIRGSYASDSGFLVGSVGYVVPAYCQHCGAPFPWTQSAIDTASALIQEDEDLTPESQERLVEVLPDIITETPKTPLAVVRFKKALLAVGKFTADALRQFAIDFGCELAKQQLDLR